MTAKNCLNILMLTQCILGALYIIVSLVGLVEILCLFINVLDVRKLFTLVVWIKKKLWKFQKKQFICESHFKSKKDLKKTQDRLQLQTLKRFVKVEKVENKKK